CGKLVAQFLKRRFVRIDFGVWLKRRVSRPYFQIIDICRNFGGSRRLCGGAARAVDRRESGDQGGEQARGQKSEDRARPPARLDPRRFEPTPEAIGVLDEIVP